MSKLLSLFFNCRGTFVWRLPCDKGFIQHHFVFMAATAIAIIGPDAFVGLLFGVGFFTVPLFFLLFC